MAYSPTVNPAAARPPTDVPASTAIAGTMGATRPAIGATARNEDLPEMPATSAQTSAAIGELVDALKNTSISLRFEIDESTHRIITKVVDKETGELIRQMPNAEVLRIAHAIDKLQGLFVSQAV